MSDFFHALFGPEGRQPPTKAFLVRHYYLTGTLLIVYLVGTICFTGLAQLVANTLIFCLMMELRQLTVEQYQAMWPARVHDASPTPEAFRITSQKTWRGLPLYDICPGQARGIFAMGLTARGIVAIGVQATGVITFGVCSMGVLAGGVCCVGLLGAAGVAALAPVAFGVGAAGIIAGGVSAWGWNVLFSVGQ